MDQNSGGIQQWLEAHPLITYVFIVACLIYVFNAVFRPRKLPILKDALVYALILAGGWLLMFFQLKVGLPIVHGFALAILLMLIVRIRSFFVRRNGAQPSAGSGRQAGSSGESEAQTVGVGDQAGGRS